MGGVYGSTKNAASRVAKFASELPQRLAKEVAPALNERTRDMFANEADPYGKPWAPIKASTLRRKAGNGVILYRIGALEAGTHVRYAGRKLVFTYGPNAQYAQDGDPSKREPRLLAPTFGIPATWKADVVAAQARIVKKGLS